MTDRFYQDVHDVLSKEGELGVSVIAKRLDIAPSTLQKYLERQTYFKKTVRAKWDLPERVNTEAAAKADETKLAILAQSLETQVLLINTQLETVFSAMQTLATQTSLIKPHLEGFRGNSPSVAKENNGEVNKEWAEFYNQLSQLPGIIRKKKESITADQFELLLNVRWHDMALEIGSKALGPISDHVADLLLGQETELRDDVVDLLVNYLKEEK